MITGIPSVTLLDSYFSQAGNMTLQGSGGWREAERGPLAPGQGPGVELRGLKYFQSQQAGLLKHHLSRTAKGWWGDCVYQGVGGTVCASPSLAFQGPAQGPVLGEAISEAPPLPRALTHYPLGTIMELHPRV